MFLPANSPLTPFRTAFDLKANATTESAKELLTAYAATLKAACPAIQKVEFEWVDGLWIWLELDPATVEGETRELLEDYPEIVNDGFGYWLMRLVGPKVFPLNLEVDVTGALAPEVAHG